MLSILHADAPTELDHEPVVRRARGGRAWVALILALGVVVTGVFAHRVAAKPGVYWADVSVLFLVPQSAANPNTLVTTSGGLTPIAGAVARMVDPDVSSARVVSPDVSIADQGIRQGSAVTLPNDGGQWADNYDRQLLDVQAVGPTLAGVNATMQRLLHEINATLTALQDRAHVARANRIHTDLSPSEPQFYYLNGRPHRAVLTTVFLGLGLTLAAAVWADRLLRRRRRHTAAANLAGSR